MNKQKENGERKVRKQIVNVERENGVTLKKGSEMRKQRKDKKKLGVRENRIRENVERESKVANNSEIEK